MSDVREDFLKMWNVGSRSEEVVSLPSTDSEFSTMNATSLLDSLKFEDPGSFLVTTTLLVLSFLSASFATLDNSTLRLDLSLSLHVESLATGFLYFSNHIDRVLRVSPDGWMHLDSIESQKLLQSSKPGLNVGFDFATILSSPCPCCILFAIVFGQLAELKFSEQQTDLKWLMLHKWRRLSHSSRVKLPLCQYVCELCFGVDIFDLNLLIQIQIDPVKQPIQSNSVGSGHVSHCWTPAFNDHLESYLVWFWDWKFK